MEGSHNLRFFGPDRGEEKRIALALVGLGGKGETVAMGEEECSMVKEGQGHE